MKDRTVFMEVFSLSETTKSISREAYDLFGVFGYVGGITAAFVSITSLILVPYSQLSFEIEAIEKLF